MPPGMLNRDDFTLSHAVAYLTVYNLTQVVSGSHHFLNQ